MTVFEEMIFVFSHKGKELRLLDLTLVRLDADLLGEDLIEQGCQLVLLFVQREKHLRIKIVKIPLRLLHLGL